MTPGLSIPTDNIYKFYALLGLAIVISSMLAFVYVYDTSRARALEWSEEARILDYKEELSEADLNRKELLASLTEVEAENKKFYMGFLQALLGAGIGIGLIGLVIWQFSVQPRSDRLIELQIKSLEIEAKQKTAGSEQKKLRYY